ncbi:Pentatricopeptide repeat-containing protein At1g18900 [Linum grandiflorum]
MIRAKQLSNLSSTARSFFVGGSRCGSVDGSSCTCSEDESCNSKGLPKRSNGILTQKASTLASKTLAGFETPTSRDAVKLLGAQTGDNVKARNAIPQIVSAPGSFVKADGATYVRGVDSVENGFPHSSPPVSDQFMKVGMAAVGFLSDMVNYKIPMSEGSGVSLPQNSAIDPTIPCSNVKSAHVKHIRAEHFSKVYPKSSEVTLRSSTTSNSSRTKGKGEKATSVKGFKQGSGAATGGSPGTNYTSSEAYGQKKTTNQRSRTQPNSSLPNPNATVKNFDGKVVHHFSSGYRKAYKDDRVPSSMASIVRHSSGSGHVENICCILRQLGWNPAAEEALGNLDCLMDAYQANQVLKQLQDHKVALGFFYWLKRKPGFKHDGHTYTTMVGVLGRAKQFASIKKLLDQMVRDGCQPNVVTYNRLIHSYGRANYLNEAVDVFNHMQKDGCEPDRVTYCTLIDIHAKAGYLDFAMDMYEKMQVAGLAPDTFTYSVMINCLGKAGHLAAADKLFSEMVEHGCTPNLVTYNVMIALQAKSRNYENALQLYRDMQNAGFEPDKVTYSIVMEALGHLGYLEEAEAVFSEMKQRNWVPDEPVYGLLVDLWGKAGNVEKARGWYETMIQTGLRPNVPTCNSLLSAFLRVHLLADAYSLLESMLALGLFPSLRTYTLLLSCCTEAPIPYDMRFWWDIMETTGHPVHAFLKSMPYAGADGQNIRDHVGKFFDVMRSEDRESKRGLVDSVVDFLHKSGLKEEAALVWEVAAEKNVYPDAVREKSSCYWLINLHVMSDGTAVTALSRTLAWFRREMLESGVSPSRIDIVTGWGRRSKVTGASMVRQAVQEMLNMFSFPFFTLNGNTGCFVGCGEPLNKWLLHPYVERMHLL